MTTRPAISVLLKTLSYAVIALISACLVIVYAHTFRGHFIQCWTHGPFNFESGVYRSYAIGQVDLRTTGDPKLLKHFLCVSLFPAFHRLVRPWCTADDSPLVCSALTGLAIAIFGCWLFRRTQSLGLTIPIILLLGFSFTTWYVGSVWESRSFIALGAVLLLIALDFLVRCPSLPRVLIAVLAMAFSLLITIGNAYLLPLLPLAVFIRVGRIGLLKAAAWSFLSLFLAIVVVAAVYQGGAAFLNPKLALSEIALLSKHESAHIRSSPAHFNFNHLRNVALQTILFSVGGLRLPATMGTSPQGNLWAYAWAASDYLARLPGLLFCLGYLGLIIAVLAAVFKTRIWSREPVIKMMLCWGLLYVSFFVYFNPWAGPVYAIELQFPLWGLVGLALHHWRPRIVMLAPWLLLPVLAWNNWSVLVFFRDFYDRLEKKEFLTADVFPTGRDSGLMIWEIKPEAMTSNTMRVEAAHALAGEKGGFRIVAYADDDNDRIPDREIAKSDYLRAANSGEWSGYTFTTRAERVYVGIAWPPDGYHFIFRSADNWPNQGPPLEGRFYYSAPPNKPRSAGPAFTNLRLSFIALN